MSAQDNINPYAAPASELVMPASSQHSWIEKKSLVVPKDWQSPPICLLTGTTTDLTPIRKKTLAWSHPGALLLIILGIIGIVAIALLQKRGTIHYYLSREKAAKIRRNLTVNWLVFGAGVLLIFMPSYMGRPALDVLLAGLALILTSAVLASTLCRPIRPGKITQTHIWLTNIPLQVREQIAAMEADSLNRPWR